MARKIIFSFIILVSLATNAFADGGFFGPWSWTVDVPPDLPGQRAVIYFDNNVERMVVQSRFKGLLDEFAWVIPVPALVTADNVNLAPLDIFEDMNDKTHPEIRITETWGDSWGIGCGSSDSGAKDINAGVVVWEEMSVGPYNIAVISSGNSHALVDWLNTNDYNFPAARDDVLDFYNLKGWYYLAAKVNPHFTLIHTDVDYALPPIEIRFPAPKAVYPMVLTSVMPNLWTTVTLYIVSSHRMEPDNRAFQEFEVKNPEDINYWWHPYEDILADLDNNVFILEYAGIIDNSFVTRYTINISCWEMTDDFFFVQSADDTTFKYKKKFYIKGSHVSANPPASGDAGLLLVFLAFLVALLALKARAKRRLRPAAAG